MGSKFGEAENTIIMRFGMLDNKECVIYMDRTKVAKDILDLPVYSLHYWGWLLTIILSGNIPPGRHTKEIAE